MTIMDLFKSENSRWKALASGHVVPESARCVQCGICSYNCPLGLDVHRHAWLDQHIEDPGFLANILRMRVFNSGEILGFKELGIGGGVSLC